MSFRILRACFALGSRPSLNLAPVIALCWYESSQRPVVPAVRLGILLVAQIISICDRSGQSFVLAETQIIQSVIATQSYDSNVWGGPKEFIPAGKKQGDLLTSISPTIQFLTKNRQMDTVFGAGVSGNLYVYNPELDFVSVNASLFSNLNGWISQFIEGAKLQVADTFVYTPQPPSFLTGGQPPPTADLLLRGIQGVRANTFLNNGSVTGSYLFGRGLGLQVGYYFGMMKFGQIFVQPTQSTAIPVVYFDTTYHSFSVGPAYAVTPADTVSVNYEPTVSYLSGPGGDLSFTTQGLTAQYTRTTTYWSGTIRGGAVTLDLGKAVYFSGGVSLIGNLDPSTKVRVNLSRKVTPAFYAIGGAILSDTAGIYIDHKISRLLTLTLGASYGRGTQIPIDLLTYTSYQGTARLSYKLTRLISTTLSYEYYSYRYDQAGSEGAPASGYSFPRNVVMLSLTATWR
jgi:hypothetical protein